jgi:hypothetical protein
MGNHTAVTGARTLVIALMTIGMVVISASAGSGQPSGLRFTSINLPFSGTPYPMSHRSQQNLAQRCVQFNSQGCSAQLPCCGTLRCVFHDYHDRSRSNRTWYTVCER